MRLIAAQSEEDVIKMKLGSQAPDWKTQVSGKAMMDARYRCV
jgi:hypothetical protein